MWFRQKNLRRSESFPSRGSCVINLTDYSINRRMQGTCEASKYTIDRHLFFFFFFSTLKRLIETQ